MYSKRKLLAVSLVVIALAGTLAVIAGAGGEPVDDSPNYIEPDPDARGGSLASGNTTGETHTESVTRTDASTETPTETPFPTPTATPNRTIQLDNVTVNETAGRHHTTIRNNFGGSIELGFAVTEHITLNRNGMELHQDQREIRPAATDGASFSTLITNEADTAIGINTTLEFQQQNGTPITTVNDSIIVPADGTVNTTYALSAERNEITINRTSP